MGGLGDEAVSAWWPPFLVSRAVVWLGGLLAIAIVDLSSRAPDFDPLGRTTPFGAFGDALVGPSARWDATWYLEIADVGYGDSEARPAFFPLYPLLIAMVSVVVRSPVVAGIVVSLACFAGALVLLRRLTELELGADAARATTWLVALGPMAFFFSAVYSESLFLLLSVGAVYCARTDRWTWVAPLGFLAGATRSAGVLLVIPLAILAWRSGRPQHLLTCAAVPLGVAAFSLYLELDGAGWRAAFDAQEVWFREFAGPFVGAWDGLVAAWDGARQLASGSKTPVYFEQAGGDPFTAARFNLMLFAFLLAAVPCLVGAFRKLAPEYGLYAIGALALPLSYPVTPQPLMSLPRFLAVVFPLWMWLGWWASRSREREVASYVVSGCLMVFFTGMFATWRFVA